MNCHTALFYPAAVASPFCQPHSSHYTRSFWLYKKLNQTCWNMFSKMSSASVLAFHLVRRTHLQRIDTQPPSGNNLLLSGERPSPWNSMTAVSSIFVVKFINNCGKSCRYWNLWKFMVQPERLLPLIDYLGTRIITVTLEKCLNESVILKKFSSH